MATRLYFSRLATAPATPSSWSTGWNTTATANTRKLLASKAGFAETVNTLTATGTTTDGHFVAHTRFISDKLTAQTISGTVKGQAACRAAGGGGPLNTTAIGIKVIKPDNSDRGVLLAVTGSDQAATPPQWDSSNEVNRQFQDVSENTSISLSSLGVSAGDRIVVELGFYQINGTTGNHSIEICASNARSDLGENNTDNTDLDPWIEFSDDIVFLPYHVNSTSVPVDDAAATNTADPTAVTPVTGMIAGDLCIMVGQQRTASVTPAISEAGGQSWTSETPISTTNNSARVFHCVFDGTWDANPSVDFTATQCNSVHMHVFRGPSGWTWSVNQALAELDFAAGATQTVTGQTATGSNPIVAIAGLFTPDDNTWAEDGSSGANWELLGSAQYRNTSGSDQSAVYFYQVQPTPGATGNVVTTQTANGNDAGTSFIMCFACVQPAQDLTPSLFTNTQTFYAPTVTTTYALTPALFENQQTYYTQTVTATYSLTPDLFTNDQTFYEPTVDQTGLTLAPSLFENTQTYYQPTVTATYVLTADLFSNAQTFYSATVTATYSLTPDLYTNEQTYYAHTIEVGALNLLPELFTNTQTYYTPTVTTTYALTAELFTNTQTFYDVTVTATYSLTPDLYENTQTFYSGTITTANTLSPERFDNSQTFYTQVVASTYDLLPSLFTNTQTFYEPEVAFQITETIQDTRFDNEQEFMLASISQSQHMQRFRMRIRRGRLV